MESGYIFNIGDYLLWMFSYNERKMMRVRKFLIILIIISIPLLGCENSLNTSNTNTSTNEPVGTDEVGNDTLTYSKVADLYNGADLYYGGNYTIQIEDGSNSKIICSYLCSYPELSPDKKRIAYIYPDEQDNPRALYIYNVENDSKDILMKSDYTGSSTPKEVRWLDDQYLLLIIGYGYGHVNYGGDLYIYDIINGGVAIPLKTSEPRTEYRDIVIKEDVITLDKVKWTDDTYNEYIVEQENITYKEVFKVINSNRTSTTKYADLNNDGEEEKIVLTVDERLGKHTLQVNNNVIAFSGETIEPTFNIVDINTNDKYKEIAISEYGPSSDYATTFFYYDNEMLFPMGEIQGFYGPAYSYGEDINWNQVKVDGNGKIITQSRGRILQTWFYQDEYRLSEEHRLVNVPKDLYEMNTEVEVNEEFTLQKSRTDASDAITLKKGEKVTIVASDNKEWCLVENSQGETGWFAVDNFDIIRGLNKRASEVFNGLSNAD